MLTIMQPASYMAWPDQFEQRNWLKINSKYKLLESRKTCFVNKCFGAEG